MNIFWHELRSHWKGLIGWSAGVFFTVVSGMAKFEGYSASGNGNISQILNAFPKPIMAVFGLSGLDISKLIGYFGVLYLYIVMVVAIHAGLLGVEIIAGEERDKTTEFLYAKPITRTNVLTQKILAGLANILIVFAVTTISSLWIVSYYNKGNSLNSQIMTLMWGVLFFQLLSLAFGAFFASFFKRPRFSATAITTLILAWYIFAVTAVLEPSFEFLNKLTPFWYFGAPKIIADGHLDLSYAVISIILIAILITSTYFFYKERDLTV